VWQSVKPLVRYGDFSIFEDGGRGYLGFSKCGNVRGRKGTEGENASPCQISWRLVKSLLRYGDFSISQDGGRCHLYFQNVGILGVGRVKGGQYAPSCQISQQLIEPFLTYGDFFSFSRWRPPPSWTFKI